MIVSSEPMGVTLSIFERLTDRSPSVSKDPPHYRSASVGGLAASVIEHLSALLNVRRSDHPQDSVFPETSSSIAAYGVVDFSSLSLANPVDREKLRRSLERAIRLFEPRLWRVHVVLEDWKPQDPGLRFRIEATLRVEPIIEPVVFSALLAKDMRRFELAEAQR